MESRVVDLLAGQQAGLWPCVRYHPWLPIVRHDSNAFCTLTVLWVLQQCSPHLPPALQQQVAAAGAAAWEALQAFRYKTDWAFNFYAKDTWFPGGVMMHRVRHFALPDDADDTCLAHLVFAQHFAPMQRNSLHQALQHHAISSPLTGQPVVGTWFGRAMRGESDCCVQVNACLFLHRFFPESELLANTLQHLQACHHLLQRVHPYQLSPNYPFQPIIAHHFSRLAIALPSSRHLMCRPLQHRGPFFSAPMLAAFHSPVARALGTSPLFHFHYASPWATQALQLEQALIHPDEQP